jgi:spermidine/putrescine transport system substrate-binding protein
MPSSNELSVSGLSRRQVLRVAGASALAAPAVLHARPARAGGVVIIMTYDGMIPADFKKAFEAETGIEIRLRLVDDQSKQFNLLAAESPYPLSDICSIAGHRIHQFVESQLLAPLDVDRLTNWNRIDPHFAKSDSILIDGGAWGVPLMTGAEVAIYNTERVKSMDSWATMFDPRYKGQTTYVIEDFMSCMLLYLGYANAVGADAENPAVVQKAVNDARDLLIKEKPQVRKYYDSGAELQQMLVNEDVVLAQGYAGTLAKLILEGEPIRFAVPKEGSFAFFFNFSLTRNAANPDNAYKLMNAMLADPKVGAAMTRSAGYMSTLIGAADSLTDREKQAFSLSPDEVSRLTFFRYQGQKLRAGFVDSAIEEVKAA